MTDEQKKATRDRIGQRIMAIREKKRMSQTELAERTGLQQAHISRIENGRYAVTLETVQAIADAMGMMVDIVKKRT